MSNTGNGVRFSAVVMVIAMVLLSLGACLSPAAVSAAGEGAPSYTLSGKVYNATGELIRGPFHGAPTMVAIDALGIRANVTSDGTYSLENVPAGEYIVKVFYGSIDYTYTYRSVNLSADTVIDWYYGKTWVQGVVLDDSGNPLPTLPRQAPVRVTIVETGQYDDTDANGYFEIANATIGEYCTISAFFGPPYYTYSYVVREIVGSAPNNIEFRYGRNAVYGFVRDGDGNPLAAEVSISPDGRSTTTNADGFYLFENVTVGTEQTVHAILTSLGGQVLSATRSIVQGAPLWANLTTVGSLPAPEFTTGSGTASSGTYAVSWGAVDGAGSYILYEGGTAVYEGVSTSFEITGRAPGTYAYTVRAVAGDIQSGLSDPILIDVLNNAGGTGTWAPGMSWSFDYSSVSTSLGTSTTDRVTLTVIDVENVPNRTGAMVSAYKVREIYDSEPDTLYYSWYDVDTLDIVARFSDAGTYTATTNCSWVYGGEPFPYAVGSAIPVYYSLRTVVSIPNHPIIGVYTNSTLEVVGMEWVTVPAGTFWCYNITVTDDISGEVHWNYYYNDTVKHWVKMVDRLPITRADVVTYELSSYDVPEGPVFITESGERNVKSFEVQWAGYEGAVGYILYENGAEVYDGTATSFALASKEDGSYEYTVEAVLFDGRHVPGGTLTIVVDYVVPSPRFTTDNGTMSGGEFTIAWTAVEGAVRYVLFENDVEIYNGTGTSFTVTDRSDGIYRYRVQTWDGNKVSELSSSLLMTVKAGTAGDDGKNGTAGEVLALSTVIIAAALVAATIWMMRKRGRGA